WPRRAESSPQWERLPILRPADLATSSRETATVRQVPRIGWYPCRTLPRSTRGRRRTSSSATTCIRSTGVAKSPPGGLETGDGFEAVRLRDCARLDAVCPKVCPKPRDSAALGAANVAENQALATSRDSTQY